MLLDIFFGVALAASPSGAFLTLAQVTTTTAPPRCGDAIVQPERGEECDPPGSLDASQCAIPIGKKAAPMCDVECRCTR